MDTRRLLPPILLIAVFAPPAAAESTEADADRTGTFRSSLTERVSVTASRLPQHAERLERIPAHVTVISRERIEASGARTLQDLLRVEAGVRVYDQVGNDVAKTLDLRGFGGGSSTKVFLDGAPLNDSRNNSLALELVPLDLLERIEIVRGPVAAQSGGGSQAGAIHLVSRQAAAGRGGTVSVAGGEYGTRRYRAGVEAAGQRSGLLVTASREEDDGFRVNAGGRLRRLGATFGLDLGRERDRRLELSLTGAEGRHGNPGALTAAELASSRNQAPFNRLDFFDRREAQASLNLRGKLVGRFTVAANLFHRDREAESLSTGRAASLFGGFFLDSGETSTGTTVQISHRGDADSAKHRWTAGFEWVEGDTRSRGVLTPANDPSRIDPANLASDNTTARRTRALFLQDDFRPAERWDLHFGLRADREDVVWAEAFPASGTRDAKRFSELSFRAGVNWRPSERYGAYASYGESFLPPTPEQLYAFPGFGSNPDLEPEVSDAFELGLRGRWPRARLHLAAFRVDTVDEIVFDPSLGAFGTNVNAGRTRRKGLEASLRGEPSPRVDLFVNATHTDATFANGPHDGNRVPLVPSTQLAAGVGLQLARGASVHGDVTYVGRQVLDNDGANLLPRLSAYTRVDARVAWRVTGIEDLVLLAEVTNLFDERYATRGIHAFDFSTFANQVFLTPAPGRRVVVGLEWNWRRGAS